MENDILLFGESEIMVKTLRKFSLEEIGSAAWKRQHEYLNKLNQQSQLNAHQASSDYVSEHLSCDKIRTIVWELINQEIWREKIAPIMTKTSDFKPHSTIPFYISLYNEAVIVNLLETVLYSTDVVECLGDSAIDLLDFCYRSLSYLFAEFQSDGHKSFDHKKDKNRPGDTYEKYRIETLLEYGPKCISILRYLAEAGDRLPLDCHTRMIRTLNLPQLLVALLDDGCGWIKSGSYYQSGSWQKCSDPLTPPQINILLLLRQLLLSDNIGAYEFHQQNVCSLLRIQKFLTPPVLSFCRPLGDLSQVLSQIQLRPPEPVKSFSLLIENEPEMRDEIITHYKDKFPAVAKNAMKTWANPSIEEMQKEAKKLSKVWQIDRMEQLLNIIPTCEVCGSEAVQRCSQCKQTWYCRRQCQVEHWKDHKSLCNLLKAQTS